MDSQPRHDAVVQLFDAARLARRTHTSRRVGSAIALLTQPAIREGRAKRKERWQQTAERFNLLDALGVADSELAHSRFMAYLLDPRSHHDQGSRFLRIFVESLQGLKAMRGDGKPSTICISAPRDAEVYDHSEVCAEFDAGEFGRIDWLIRLGNGSRIAVENKVWAGEQDKQAERYCEWLRREAADSWLIFLTPNGRAPLTSAQRDHFLLMSYGDLAGIVDAMANSLPKSATPLHATLVQYSELCRRIQAGGTNMPDLSEEILELLRDPVQLEVALDVAAHLPAIRLEILNEFRGHVVNVMRQRLGEFPNGEASWSASIDPESSERLGFFPTGPRQSPCYHFRVGLNLDRGSEWGWVRPVPLPDNFQKGADLQALEDRIRDAWKSTPTPWWVAWRALRNEAGALGIRESRLLTTADAESLIAVHRDNLDPAHPLAVKVGDWMFDKFQQFRADIEELQDFRPRPSR